MTHLLIFLACHFVGDFGLQNAWVAEEKNRSLEVTFYHTAVYTAVFILFSHLSLTAMLFLFVSHFCIDLLKSKYKIIKPIYVDQLFHIIIILSIIFFKF